MGLKDRFAVILNETKLKQKELASIMGVSDSYVSYIVRGNKTNLSNTLANLIEARLGYSAEWVLHGTGNKIKHDSKDKAATYEQERARSQIEHMTNEQVKAVNMYIHKLLNSETEAIKRMLRVAFRATFVFAKSKNINFKAGDELDSIAEKIKHDILKNAEIAEIFNEKGLTEESAKNLVDEAMDEIVYEYLFMQKDFFP
jgi:transcriptional regulator with XRE-family HTH domain